MIRFTHAALAVALLTMVSAPTLASAQVRLTEFMAANSGTLVDEDGDFEDWIEVQNQSPITINL